VNTSELAAGIRRLGVQLSPNELLALRDELDVNFAGKVSRNEFRAAMELRRPGVGKDVSLWVSILALISDEAGEWQSSVEAMFAGFDEDGDGQITVLEFVRGLKALGVQLTSSDQVVAFAREIDTDGDGEVSWQQQQQQQIVRAAERMRKQQD
jgi:Ca2+-binding EF-hand superfamily protein